MELAVLAFICAAAGTLMVLTTVAFLLIDICAELRRLRGELASDRRRAADAIAAAETDDDLPRFEDYQGIEQRRPR